MDSVAPVSEDIRKLQDTTVTLRTTVPDIYKRLLHKEEQLERQQICATDISVPKHPIHELNKLKRLHRQVLPQQNATEEVRQAHQMLNILDNLFPGNTR